MVQTDNETAIKEMLVKNYQKYYKIAYSYVYQEADALDIIQESAYKAMLKSELLKSLEYADTWICKIVMNEALQFLRKKKKEYVGLDQTEQEACLLYTSTKICFLLLILNSCSALLQKNISINPPPLSWRIFIKKYFLWSRNRELI